jgi:hypothetical protein
VPACGAVVRVKGTAICTRTDDAGSFRLPWGRRITASLPGHYIAGAKARADLALHLRPLPTQDNPDYEWVSPTPDSADEGRCGNCHRTTYREWSGSAHAQSTTSPHFLRFYDQLLSERPDGSAVCSSCHAPAIRDDDALVNLRKLEGVAAQGTHCDYCHKVAGLEDGEVGLTHGRYLLKLLRPKEGQLFFGPLDDVDRGEDAHSPLYRDSRYCAACHEGTVFGVPVYTTYSEWQASPARRMGQHCQDCHMKPTGSMANTAPGHGGIDRNPLTLSNHSFWDGSQLAMLRRSLNAEASFDGPSVSIRITAKGVGHRVPTGFIERRLEAQAVGLNAAGQVIGVHRWAYRKNTRGDGTGKKAPFWRATADVDDNRLSPGVPDTRRLKFGPGLASVQFRLTHRRYEGGPGLLVLDRAFSPPEDERGQ